MNPGIVSVNGQVSSLENACIPADDRGFLFADNVFEVIVGFKDQLLDLDKHLVRLRSSADELGIDLPWSDEDLAFEVTSLAEQFSCDKKYIRLVITRGCGFGLAVEPIKPNKIIYIMPTKTEVESIYHDGVSLKLKRLPYTERGTTAKTGNYLRSILAMKQARENGYDDILWYNSSEEIAEASTSNIFVIGREGDLVEIATPSVNCGILEGITRATIITLLTNAHIKVTERVIDREEIARFDEAFICSTIRGLIPVKKIDSHKLHTKRRNSVFNHIERLYLTWVESQLGYRVDWNTGKHLIPKTDLS